MRYLEKAREHADNGWVMPHGPKRDLEYALALRHTISALEEQQRLLDVLKSERATEEQTT